MLFFVANVNLDFEIKEIPNLDKFIMFSVIVKKMCHLFHLFKHLEISGIPSKPMLKLYLVFND